LGSDILEKIHGGIMIIYEQDGKDILTCNVEAVVNPVSCVGVMGRGLAAQIKQAYPANFEAYRKACGDGDIHLGRMFVYRRRTNHYPKYIINFPTKFSWKARDYILDIHNGLIDLARFIQDKGITSIAIPALGCGLGGLDWGQVKFLIEQTLSGIEGLTVHVFPPGKY
jgi:O-acetyl-ADP-ribose deacetylase (regulator of RNase III)